MKKFEPDFEQMLKVLRREKPDRPVLFELFMNGYFYEYFAGHPVDWNDPLGDLKQKIDAFVAGGYDYASVYASGFHFQRAPKDQKKTLSLNGTSLIYDRKSYEEYVWPDAENFDYSAMEKIKPYMPDNLKFMCMGPGGLIENVIRIVGYDNLCIMIYEDEELVQEIFDQAGSRLLKYYEIGAQFDTVGLIMANDDWGFNTQTFLSPDQMRKYVFPWHKKIVEAAHKEGKPAVLHSCGNPFEVMDDVIDYIRFDGRHSYEDNIMPVEEFYKKWSDRIAILGGMDMDFLTRSTEEQIRSRVRGMLELTAEKGGYALGSGNSVADFIPPKNFLAMLDEAYKMR